ncbi:MAG: NAD(P)H-binding protein [Actinomycetota bacterium]|nr:NAD(P)H-binding protein [Actinomycetota bacterium]
MQRTMFVLGGTGFIGSRVVAEALASDWEVKALARSERSAATLSVAGATPVRAEVRDPAAWQAELSGAEAVVDLVQPAFPKRLGRRAVVKIAGQRQETTQGVLEALGSRPPDERPLLIYVSGVDDLVPDENGVVSERSKPGRGDQGLSAIGIPARGLIERSEVVATFVYFGAMVYGAGKVYADVFVDGLKKRRARVLGDGHNHFPLTHVDDAARALVHIAGLARSTTAGRTFVAADGSDTTQRELMDLTAAGMGRKSPGSIPTGIAALVAGRPAVETMTTDLHANPAALIETGFEFRYPSPRAGVTQALDELGELKAR